MKDSSTPGEVTPAHHRETDGDPQAVVSLCDYREKRRKLRDFRAWLGTKSHAELAELERQARQDSFDVLLGSVAVAGIYMLAQAFPRRP